MGWTGVLSVKCVKTGKKLNIDRGVLSSANVLKLW